MPSARGFWSYRHADDDADRGRIAELARDLVAEYEMQTNERIELFLDRDTLEWGDPWRDKVDATLSNVAFFIPVLTPRYFKSPECRRELQFFARAAERLGVKELVLPLLYVDVPEIHDRDPEDDLVSFVRDFNWADWRDLRYAARDSEDYRRGVAKLAQRLVEANRAAEQTDIAEVVERLETPAGDEGDPGIIDRIAAAEEAMPAWTETLDRIAAAITGIGEAMTHATADLHQADRRGAGFAGRLSIARRVASELRDPANEILELGNDFTTHLHAVDSGIRAIIEAAPENVEGDDDARAEICGFFGMVRDLSAAAHEGLGQLSEMIDAIAPIERMSRDLRPPLRAMRQGLILMLEGREVSDEWITLIDQSPIDCSSLRNSTDNGQREARFDKLD